MTHKISWSHIGSITIEDNLPKLPEGGLNKSGLYRLRFFDNGYHYIGQTGRRIKDRLREYRSPTLGNAQEYFIRQALGDSKGAELDICDADDFGETNNLRILESHAVSEARKSGIPLLNRSKPLDPYIIKLMIKTYEELAEEMRRTLSNNEVNSCK